MKNRISKRRNPEEIPNEDQTPNEESYIGEQTPEETPEESPNEESYTSDQNQNFILDGEILITSKDFQKYVISQEKDHEIRPK